MKVKLTQTNIEKKLTEYIRKVNSIKPPALHGMKYLYYLKREPHGSEPYGDKSLFEASNLIFSELVILLGVKQLLTEPLVNNIRLPFKEYEVVCGVGPGNDINAISGELRLIGEAFNVAQSLFQSKKSATIEKLRSNKNADYRLIIFNADAVKKPDKYYDKSDRNMLYLPVKIWDNSGEFIALDP